MTKTPDQWLEEISPAERTKGILKLFLGYAPGCGKDLQHVERSHSGGAAAAKTWSSGSSKPTEGKASRNSPLSSNRFPAGKSNTKAPCLRRWTPTPSRPEILASFSSTNWPTPTFREASAGRRYEDVLDLVEAKMEVLSTVNVQHLESISPMVGAITGIKIRETVPDWVLEHANEIVMVDLTPEALQNRMKRGEVYHSEKVDLALKNFFRRGNLIALRELALRQVAEQVDRSLESYMEQKDIQDPWPVRERIAVCFSSNPRAQYLIARAARMARRMDAELFAIYVDLGQDTSAQDQNSLNANIQFSESLGAKVEKLTGKDVSSATAEFVRDKACDAGNLRPLGR